MGVAKFNNIIQPTRISFPGSPAPRKGQAVMRLELRSTDIATDEALFIGNLIATGVTHAKYSGRPQIPGGFTGGNGPYGDGELSRKGFSFYVPLDYVTANEADLVFAIWGTPEAGGDTSGDPEDPTALSADPPTADDEVDVSTDSQLTAAINEWEEGDHIILSNRNWGEIRLTGRHGAEGAPFVIRGGSGAIVAGVDLRGCSRIYTKGFTIQNTFYGIQTENGGANDCVHDGHIIEQIGQEGLMWKDASSRNTIQRCTVRSTGQSNRRFGEGVYIGQHTGGDLCIGNRVLQNAFSTIAEAVDIKPGGPADTVVADNTINCGFIVFESGHVDSAVSDAGIRTVGYRNEFVGTAPQNCVTCHGSGENQLWEDNEAEDTPDFMFRVLAGSNAVIGSGNTLTGSGTLSNVSTQTVDDPPSSGTPVPDWADQRDPMVALEIVNGQWRIRSRTDTDGTGTPTTTTHYTADIAKGDWTDWKVEADWDASGSGALNVHRGDGTGAYSQVVTYSGALGYNQTYPGFESILIAKSAFVDTTTRVLYADVLHVTDDNGSLDLVDPRGIPPGSGPTDPGPPPNPIVGTKPFGAFALPTSGLGVYNSTYVTVTPQTVVSVLSSARSAGMKLLLCPGGPPSVWNSPRGTMSLAAYDANVNALANNATTNAAIENALEDGTDLFGFDLFDEPKAAERYGREITDGEITTRANLVQSKWPGSRMFVGLPPSRSPLTKYHANCGYRFQWALRKGPLATWYGGEIAAAQARDAEAVIGMNVIDFTGSPNPGVADTYTTPGQFLTYGTQMIHNPYAKIVGWICWKHESEWLAQAGMEDAVEELCELWHELHP